MMEETLSKQNLEKTELRMWCHKLHNTLSSMRTGIDSIEDKNVTKTALRNLFESANENIEELYTEIKSKYKNLEKRG